MRKGNLFVISGPSGAGKGTLVAGLLEQVPDAWFSVSATTRKAREGEIDGKSYFFVDNARFEEMIANDELLEWARYTDKCYGTPRRSVEEHIANGCQVLLDIEIQGARQVKSKMPEAHLVFIEPPSLEELRRRLEGRGTESPEQIDLRMKTSEMELACKSEYDYVVVNDDVNEALSQLLSYIDSQANG